MVGLIGRWAKLRLSRGFARRTRLRRPILKSVVRPRPSNRSAISPIFQQECHAYLKRHELRFDDQYFWDRQRLRPSLWDGALCIAIQALRAWLLLACPSGTKAIRPPSARPKISLGRLQKDFCIFTFTLQMAAFSDRNGHWPQMAAGSGWKGVANGFGRPARTPEFSEESSNDHGIMLA
jgi:hypothetical protein